MTTTTPAPLTIALTDAQYNAVMALVAPLCIAGTAYERRELAHELVGCVWLLALGLAVSTPAARRNVTRVTISAEPRRRRVQVTRFAGLTATRARVYYGVTAASFARLARLTGGANFTERAA